MTSTAPDEPQGWLASPARDWAGSGLVLGAAGLMGLAAVGGAGVDLWTGDVRGGRLSGAALLPYAAALISVGVVLVRRRAKMWHVLVALLLLTPTQWIDAWLIGPGRPLEVPWVQLAFACWLLSDWARWFRRARTRRSSVHVDAG